MRAVRAKCLDCSGRSSKEVSLCTVKTCPLWPFRLGRRPRIGSEEEGVHQAMGTLTIDELSDLEAVSAALDN